MAGNTGENVWKRAKIGLVKQTDRKKGRWRKGKCVCLAALLLVNDQEKNSLLGKVL